jgi:hypothetical protein
MDVRQWLEVALFLALMGAFLLLADRKTRGRRAD